MIGLTPRQRATAAKGKFPYPHRTVAEVDAVERSRRQRELAPAFQSHGLQWCAQCDSTVPLTVAAACMSPFCPYRKALAA